MKNALKYSIIKIIRKKGECIYIFNKRVLYYTKQISKIFIIALVGLLIMIGIILLKYKPIYAVTTSEYEIGYIENKSKFEEKINQNIKGYSGRNVESVLLNEEPNYELKLVDRSIETNEDKVIAKLQEDAIITYKYYEIAVNDLEKAYVNTQEEAESIVSFIKSENIENKEDLQIDINERTTEDIENVNIASVQTVKNILTFEVEEEVERIQEEKNTPVINEVRLAVIPVNGSISSRFGVSSRIRSSTHTGLDIACASGTDIKVVADGTVTSVTSGGAYGNLLKVSHGNGVETWYAHCSKIYVKQGQAVKAGDVVAAVGSTGNSTGPHLHLEIRIDGTAVNPQNYLYK